MRVGGGQAAPASTDRLLRATASLTAVLFGLLLVSRRSDEPELWGRYSLAYAACLVAYVPLLISSLWFAVRGGAVVGVVRSVLSIRLFQVGYALLLLPLFAIVWRYQQDRAATDVMRAAVVGVAGVTYVMSAIGVAGRPGVARLEAWLKQVVLVFGSLLFTAATASVLLAITGSANEDVVSRMEARATYALGRTPNAEFVHSGQPGRIREFAHTIKNNSLGFHDRERVFENTQGRQRIVVLGDSYVEAHHVPTGRSFTAQLEQLLNAEDDRYEVIPLGRGGTGQEEELRNLEEFGIPFGPDVILVLFVSNDLYDNDPELGRAYRTFSSRWSSAPREPRALLFPELAIDRWVTARLHEVLARYGYLIDPSLAKKTIRPDSLAYVLSLDEPPLREAVSKTESLFDAIVTLAADEGSDLIFADLPRLETRERFVHNHPAFRSADVDMDRLSRWVAAYAESRGAQFVDLKRPFRQHLYNGGAPLVWEHDGHWNEVGHRVAAEAIFRFLREHAAPN